MATRGKDYYALEEALAGKDCATCALTLRGLQRYFDLLTYERVTDVNLRAVIRAARGFCPPHAQLLQEARSALGCAIIYRDLLSTATRALDGDGAASGSLGLRLRQVIAGGQEAAIPALAPQQPCPGCVRRQEFEEGVVDLLLQNLSEDALLPAFRASAGLCVPHLRLALGRAPDATSSARLKQAQGVIWQQLQAELDELIRKHDHRFTGEQVGAEATSWLRAIALISGRPGLCP